MLNVHIYYNNMKRLLIQIEKIIFRYTLKLYVIYRYFHLMPTIISIRMIYS